MGSGSFVGARVLITGGLGFIGSNLARRLVDEASEVILLDSLVPLHGGNRFNIDGIEDRVRVHEADLRETGLVRSIVENVDYVFNLAGQTAHLDSMEEPLRDLEMNCAAQLSLLEACRRVNPEAKVVFASTRQIYGSPEYLPVDEEHPLGPVDVNGIHKLAGERYHLLYRDVYGIRSCALRLTNTIGPRMRVKDARQTFLGTWIRALLVGEPFEVWGGEQLRDFNYVDDVVEVMLLAASDDSADGEIFNLGSEEVVSLQDLADVLVDVSGGGRYEIRTFPPDRKRIDIGDYHGDFGKIRSTLGWSPRTPLREALFRTLEYYRRHLDRYL